MTATAHSHEPHLASPDVNPSFTKGVFLGEIREDLVFPFPALTAEERESLHDDPRLVPRLRRGARRLARSSTTTASFPDACARACTSSA